MPDVIIKSPIKYLLRADGRLVEDVEEAAVVEAAAPDISSPGQPFRALLVVVGEHTSDGRVFDAITWREPPLTLYAQLENSEGHRDAPIVGRIDRIVSDGPEVWGYGVLDTVDEAAAKTVRFIRERYLRGVSVDAAQDSAVEVYQDESGVMHFSGEIGALTIVGFPAFRDTQIELLDAAPDLPSPVVVDGTLAAAMMEHPFQPGPDGKCSVCGMTRAAHDAAMSSATPTAFAVSGATNLPLADMGRAWDGVAAEKRVRTWADATDAPNAKYARAFFIVDGDASKFGSYHLGFADVIDGTLTAVPHGIMACAGAIQGARGASNPAFQAAKPRVAAYYRKMDMTPPWEQDMAVTVEDFDGVGLVASARPVLPAAAFTRPDMRRREPFRIEDDDRIWGHIYGWGECHIGSPAGRCVKPTPSSTNYAYFLTGSVLTERGEVAVGQIVISTDHAPLDLGWSVARDHYAHTGLVVADVTCGEDEYGIWVAGMVRPGVSPEVLHAFHAARQVSGDWRPVGAGLELVAILTVNVAGYPYRPITVGLSGNRVTALVASARLVEHDCGCGGTAAVAEAFARLEEVEAFLRPLQERARAERAAAIAALEAELGLDVASRIEALRADVGV